MAVYKGTLHRMIENIDDPTKLRLVFNAINSLKAHLSIPN